MMKNVTLLFLSTIMLAVNSAQPQGYREGNFPLSAFSPQPCDTMIETHTFDGDCCALNSTEGGGCVLNVINGRCEINGPVWALEYVSTYRVNGAKCPPSEYIVAFTLNPTSSPTQVKSASPSITASTMPSTTPTGSTMMPSTTPTDSTMMPSVSDAAAAAQPFGNGLFGPSKGRGFGVGVVLVETFIISAIIMTIL